MDPHIKALSAYSFAASGLDRLFALLLAALIAALYGVSPETDAYFFALVVPLTMGLVLMDAAYTAALPRLTGDTTRAGANHALLVIATASGALLVPYVGILLVASPARLAVWMTLAPLLFVLPVSGVYAALLVRDQRYALATMRIPMATGLALVVMAILSQISRSILVPAISVTIAYLTMLFVIAFVAARRKPAHSAMTPTPRGDVLRSFVAAGGALAAGGPIIVLAERALANTLQEGSVTLLTFARGLALLPLLVPVAIANGVFPAAVERVRAAERAHLSRLVLESVRLALLTALAAGLVVVLRRRELVRVALERGEFDSGEAAATAVLVAIMGVAVVGLGAGVVGTRVLFALGRRRVVTAIGGGSLLGYALLAPAFAAVAGAAGLATAYAVVSLLLGIVTLGFVATTLEVSAADALRGWVVAPALLAVPFAGGALMGQLLVPSAGGTGRAGLGIAVSVALGLVCIGATILALRPAEYHVVRRAFGIGARDET